ncbi:MAG: nucleotidyl transferase AbiEii/AbiGii toxin family protein [Ardenticatenia bacterium]|nr:nucleotidyl transferase AbiEii/AbiGii toxin family protein [Ardenticatenia bacterium]
MQALVANGLNDKISMGGGFGLLHYLDYRTTHDVDAWWDASATSQEKDQIIQVIEAALSPYGQVQRRAWGDVVSIELVQTNRTVFSFQIAQRSAQLQPSVSATWIDVSLDSLPDLVAGKMVALIERGAPRDFRDVYALCHAGLTTPKQCWQLWRQRQQLAGSDTDSHRARLAIETHLTRIALHRPLDDISDPDQKEETEHVRTWFREGFLDALVD